MLVVCGTGHRPDKLGGEYDLKGPVTKAIAAEIYSLLDRLKPDYVISGMAQGFDQILAVCAINHGINLHAAIPCDGQELLWPKASQMLYASILKRAWCQTVVNPGPYEPWKMQARNIWMVDNSDEVIACWDGTKGGTSNCVDYVLKWPKKKVHRINPKELTRMMLK